jgi:AcrR family transcriptional regulator
MMTEKPGLTRQERKFADRWEQILKSAALLFAMKGYHRTTTKEIAEAADVSEGTLYNYFESKNDLLFGIVGQLAKSQEEEDWLNSTPSTDLRQFFVSLLRQRGGFAEQNQAMLQAVLSEILADAQLRERFYQQVVQPTLQMVEKQLQLRVQLGQIRPIDIPMTARFVVALFNGLFLMRVLGDPLTQDKWDELSEVITSITFDGVALQKAKSKAIDPLENVSIESTKE